ncbi:MAG: DEAD/DEAH box helicase [Chloroflexi bacterium]|nr:DEAD/DEAH box helicase [Chloroflexota bacterium]
MESGDRFELNISADFLRSGKLPLEPALSSFLSAGDVVTLEAGAGPVALQYDPVAAALLGAELRRLADYPGELFLECLSTQPWQFRLVLTPLPVTSITTQGLTTEEGVPIAFDSGDSQLLGKGRLGIAGLRDFRLSLWAADLGRVAGFNQLLCLPLLHGVELLDHQLRTARTVLRRLRGRALLCDEVGLGKTIEAGIILSELVVRGLARRVLILTPPSLLEQWKGEMRQKFGLDFITHDDPVFREEGASAWGQHDHIVASYHTAKRDPHRAAILSHEWDVVIIDEVHHFRNRQTLLWRFAAELRKKYILLLTATPVQNDLEELFNLVTLLQPGLLSTARAFQRKFVDRRDKLAPRNVEELHQLLAEVMVRNRRSTVGVSLTHRMAYTETVHLSEPEMQLYERVSHFIRAQLLRGTGRGSMSRTALLTVQREIGSSSLAAAPTLERLALDTGLAAPEQQALRDLAAAARSTAQNAKAERLLALLQTFPDKMVIFTQFRETQAMLHRRLMEAGEAVVLFHGGLPRLQKEEAIRAFQGPARILLSTDAGSEGRNLQFCHALCNFDLPWNPMKIEQRVGRLSRIGQSHDVYVFNLVAANTLEAAILHLLEAKIAMFELVIGEIDMILGNLDEEQEFEELVTDLWVQSEDTSDFRTALDRLGDRLVVARETYLRQRAYEDRIFAGRFAPEG